MNIRRWGHLAGTVILKRMALNVSVKHNVCSKSWIYGFYRIKEVPFYSWIVERFCLLMIKKKNEDSKKWVGQQPHEQIVCDSSVETESLWSSVPVLCD